MIKVTVNPNEDFNMVVQKFRRYTARVKKIAGRSRYFMNKKEKRALKRKMNAYYLR